MSDDSESIQATSPGRSWFKAYRSHDAIELWKANHNAFWLLYVVAWRAKYSSGFNAHGLTHGQCLLGDCEAIGLSEQQYRTAKAFLEKHGFATFKPTTKGTIATLISTSIFEVLPCEPNEQTNGRVTDAQRTGNGRVTTNVEGYKDRMIESIEPPPQTPPTFQDVLTFGKGLGAEEGSLKEWFNEKQTEGWRFEGKPIRRWKAMLKSWVEHNGKTPGASKGSWERTSREEHIELKPFPGCGKPKSKEIQEDIHVRIL